MVSNSNSAQEPAETSKGPTEHRTVYNKYSRKLTQRLTATEHGHYIDSNVLMNKVETYKCVQHELHKHPKQ
jgi:hypothetical protein